MALNINICSPHLTMGDDERAMRFYTELVKYIKEFTVVNEIENENKILELRDKMDKDDLIILFNSSLEFSEDIIKLIRKARSKQAYIWPVAMDRKDESRLPHELINKKQSFDVAVRTENRNSENLSVVAQIFAREIISEVLPTFYAETKKLLFLSHKRLDGEDIVAKLCDKIILLGRGREAKSGREAFRDVIEVRVGENAQEIIDEALRISDVLIYLHTPKSVTSMWIQKEVVYALLNGIPILWIQIDNADMEGLVVRPSENPHLSYKSSDFSDADKLEYIVNEIEHQCFQLVMRNRRSVINQKEKFESWANAQGINFTSIDKTLQIYKAEYKEKRGGKYPRRPIVQYIQYFGRTIKDDDARAFGEYIKENKYMLNMDSGVLLSYDEHYHEYESNIVRNGFEKHIEYWENEVGRHSRELNGKKIVISGAFPDCEEYKKQVLTEAVNVFAQEIISYGYTLVFGAHPTFQKLIFEIAKRESDMPEKSVHMYVCKRYDYDIRELRKNATVVETMDTGDRDSSLTYMRKEMLADKDIVAVICIGGKVKEDAPEKQGVDEEADIARRNGIPVFMVGSVGGLSSMRADALSKSKEWYTINDADEELNIKFKNSIKYRDIFASLDKYIRNNNNEI